MVVSGKGCKIARCSFPFCFLLSKLDVKRRKGFLVRSSPELFWGSCCTAELKLGIISSSSPPHSSSQPRIQTGSGVSCARPAGCSSDCSASLPSSLRLRGVFWRVGFQWPPWLAGSEDCLYGQLVFILCGVGFVVGCWNMTQCLFVCNSCNPRSRDSSGKQRGNPERNQRGN